MRRINRITKVVIDKGKIYTLPKPRSGNYYLIPEADFNALVKSDMIEREIIYKMNDKLKEVFPDKIEVEKVEYYRNGEIVVVPNTELLVRYPTLEVELNEVEDEAKK